MNLGSKTCTTEEEVAAAGRFFEVEGGEGAIVGFGETGDTGDGLCGVIDADLVMLNALQLSQRAFRRQVAVGGAEALASYQMQLCRSSAGTPVYNAVV